MNRTKVVLIALLTMLLVLSMGATPAAASGAQPQGDQMALLQQLGVRSFDGIVVDSALTHEQAIGSDSVVPSEGRAIHVVMKPELRVVPVAYWGLGASGQPDNRIHVGQIVVHKALVADTIKLFAKVFSLRFPVHSVIPESVFGYDDQQSMAANNSSNYRPEPYSEHARGAAWDLNPVQNPFDLSAYNGTPAQPAGAVYNPSAPGTITMEGALRRYAGSFNLEWGGNWGNPNADPQIDFFRIGYFDYQHFQLNVLRYDAFNAGLPSCMQDWTC
ncbi:MAG TPA: M15 family metallopeptidase [Candidatus Saccharimonadales bacterium]|nr:M15 family metallopeptidase [Candidatus Saccharimonadales bacterium]